MGSKLEPMLWSHDTGQQILCFDRCKLTITRVSITSEIAVHDSPLKVAV